MQDAYRPPCSKSFGGGTYLCWGYPPLPGGIYLSWGRGEAPTLAGEWVPTLAGGRGTYFGWGEGVPTLAGGGAYLGRGRGTYFGGGRGYLPWLGEGVPWQERGTYLGQRKGYIPWLGGTYLGQGTPSPWVWADKQTETITFPPSYGCGH